MKLYEIDAAIENLFDPETGEIFDDEQLKALEMERSQKISYIACKAKNARANAEALKAEKKVLEQRQKAEEKIAESCARFLAGYLNGEKFSDSKCAITYRKSTQTVIADNLDLNTLPDDCKKITIEANKTAIKEAILAGKKIDGCSLVEKNNIQIR